MPSRQKSPRQFQECPNSRVEMTYPISSFSLNSDGVPRVTCPGCGKLVGFIRFHPDPDKNVATGTHPYHKLDVPRAAYYDESSPGGIPKEALDVIYRQATSAPKGRVTIRAMDARMLVREVLAWRALYPSAATPDPKGNAQ